MAKENLFFFAFPSAAYLIQNFCKRVQSKFTFRLPSAAKIYSKIAQTEDNAQSAKIRIADCNLN